MLFFKSVMDKAIEFEETGYALYVKLAKNSKDKLTKALFTSLAAQEKDHIAYIQAFTKHNTFKKYKTTTVESAIKKVWTVAKKESIAATKDKLKGYELAMKMEEKGYKLYTVAVAKAKTADEKKFYEFLKSMEQEHYASLANVYFYMTNNDSWLAENESQTWNWMNL
jgi:rubrerythrin